MQKVISFASLLAGSLAIALNGCAVGPEFQPPEIDAPAHYEPQPGTVSSASNEIDTGWWKSFRDPELSSLVKRLSDQNLDLQTAAERVIQSEAQRQVAAAQGLPHIEGRSETTYQRQSKNGTLSLLTPSPGAPLQYGLFRDGLVSSWELDLFGRVSRAVEAADARTLEAVENRHAMALSAISELAQNYMQLRGTQRRLTIAARNLKLAQDNVALVNTRFGNGVATTLDVAQAKAQEATIAASLPPLKTEEAELINSIGLLLGQAPRALEGELRSAKALPRLPRLVPVGIPGKLARRRPDLRQAEARLHEATAQTGVAVANFYPDVVLNGSANFESLYLTSLLTPGSAAFTIGPTISLPIFEGGRLKSTLELRESQQREAGIAFQKTLLTAWREVDDSLTAYGQAQHRRVELARAVAQNEIALQAAKQRYTEGAIDFLNVNATLSQLLQSENELADSDTQITTDLVSLYRALGGGWEIADKPPADAGVASGDH